MTTLFSLSSMFVLPFWLLMILTPRWGITRRVMQSPWTPIVPVLLYALLVLPRCAQIWPAVSHPTLPGIITLLATPVGATIAWLHFLAFDLFVGRWIYLDSQRRGFSPWLIAPILFLTLQLGPLGFVLYLGLQAVVPHHTKIFFLGRRAWALNRPLALTGLITLVLFVGALVGLLFDPRLITGAPAWLKPAKFAVSSSIYTFTLLWLLRYVQNRRATAGISRIVAGTLLVEMGAIFLQAARGTTSHFNISTPFDTILWASMGIAILGLWLATLLVTILLLRQRLADSAFAWSLRWGLILALVGMLMALPMTVHPTQSQWAARRAGKPLTTIGGHTVGAPDGGPGLPVTNWSTRAGDLRVPHFVGLHALQLFPIFGWLLTHTRRWKERTCIALVWACGFAYLGVLLILFQQALRGHSVISFDPITLRAWELWGVAFTGSVLVIPRAPRRVFFRSAAETA